MPVVDGTFTPNKPLTAAERPVRWANINKHILERRRIVEEATRPLAQRLGYLIGSGIDATATERQLRDFLFTMLEDTFEFGRREAQSEIALLRDANARLYPQGLPPESVTAARREVRVRDVRKWDAERARQFFEDEVEDAVDEIRAAAAAYEEPVSSAAAAGKMLRDQVLMNVGMALGLGRTNGAMTMPPERGGPPSFAMRSEQLDRNTCDPCSQYHGTIVQVDSSEYFQVLPPAFCYGMGRCRGVMVFADGVRDLRAGGEPGPTPSPLPQELQRLPEPAPEQLPAIDMARDARINTLKFQGRTTKEIADETGLSTVRVNRILSAQKKPGAARNALIQQLRTEGRTLAQIAEQTGLSTTRVGRLLKEIEGGGGQVTKVTKVTQVTKPPPPPPGYKVEVHRTSAAERKLFTDDPDSFAAYTLYEEKYQPIYEKLTREINQAGWADDVANQAYEAAGQVGFKTVQVLRDASGRLQGIMAVDEFDDVLRVYGLATATPEARMLLMREAATLAQRQRKGLSFYASDEATQNWLRQLGLQARNPAKPYEFSWTREEAAQFARGGKSLVPVGPKPPVKGAERVEPYDDYSHRELYKFKGGWSKDIRGVRVVIEDGFGTSYADIWRHYDEMLKSMKPAVRAKLRTINHLKGRNPQDAYWAEQYKTPGFLSSATGGGGQINFWRDGNRTDLMEDTTFWHEVGHAISPTSGPFDSSAWARAVNYDDKLSELRKGVFMTPTGQTRLGSKVGRMKMDQKGSWSSYGDNAPDEDWAELFMLFMMERQYGLLFRNSLGEAISIAQLYPQRVKLMSQWTGMRLKKAGVPLKPPKTKKVVEGKALTDKFKKEDWRAKGYTREERDAIGSYQGVGYRTISDHLRRGVAGYGAETMVRYIDDAMRRYSLDEDIVVYRGMRNFLNKIGLGSTNDWQRAIGVEFEDVGYASTSTNYSTAKKFAGDAIVHIRVPPGIRGAWLDTGGVTGSSGYEYEFLLQRGLRYRVTAIKLRAGSTSRYDVYVEVIGRVRR